MDQLPLKRAIAFSSAALETRLDKQVSPLYSFSDKTAYLKPVIAENRKKTLPDFAIDHELSFREEPLTAATGQ